MNAVILLDKRHPTILDLLLRRGEKTGQGHGDHINRKGALGPKIGIRLNATILIKLGVNCFTSGTFTSVRELHVEWGIVSCLFSLTVLHKNSFSGYQSAVMFALNVLHSF